MNLINSDSELIRVFLRCLDDLGVKREELKISLRLYEDVNYKEAKIFWSKITGVSQNLFTGVEIITGKKYGKLRYGMCRVRVRKSSYYFKLIMNMIDLIKSKL